ncbi:DUF2809 domain-containing protein [Mucilaginibacter sp. RS28]|uniref:DUF2809 domain-containing protein n=1 Tax=Mucilaginibacter straminoryzae TaxID=2932774 RepID=A0A9X1X179_9SPHI|nr:DUF2809 domain-containing protein [Mucilaginibacter straminoryzae]MCJ8209153.1 DUF2809 domain-containing protein [Mucilaginibacter straminoryzae]
MTFNKSYFIAALLLFFTEVLIAAYFHDAVIRPFGGDLLVVILIYCSLKSVFKVPVLPAALGVLILAFFMEFMQYMNMLCWLGLEHNSFARLVMGSYFAWGDLVAYFLGFVAILVIETAKEMRRGGNDTKTIVD